MVRGRDHPPAGPFQRARPERCNQLAGSQPGKSEGAGREALGIADCDQPGRPMAQPGQARRRARNAGANLRVVHRGLRHSGSRRGPNLPRRDRPAPWLIGRSVTAEDDPWHVPQNLMLYRTARCRKSQIWNAAQPVVRLLSQDLRHRMHSTNISRDRTAVPIATQDRAPPQHPTSWRQVHRRALARISPPENSSNRYLIGVSRKLAPARARLIDRQKRLQEPVWETLQDRPTRWPGEIHGTAGTMTVPICNATESAGLGSTLLHFRK